MVEWNLKKEAPHPIKLLRLKGKISDKKEVCYLEVPFATPINTKDLEEVIIELQ